MKLSFIDNIINTDNVRMGKPGSGLDNISVVLVEPQISEVSL